MAEQDAENHMVLPYADDDLEHELPPKGTNFRYRCRGCDHFFDKSLVLKTNKGLRNCCPQCGCPYVRMVDDLGATIKEIGGLA